MATDAVHKDYYESSNLARFPFEPYWPDKKLKVGRAQESGPLRP